MRTRTVQLSTGWLFTWKLPAPSPATGNRGDLRQGKEKKREDRGHTGAGASQAVVGVEYRQGGRGRILKMKKEQKGATTEMVILWGKYSMWELFIAWRDQQP